MSFLGINDDGNVNALSPAETMLHKTQNIIMYRSNQLQRETGRKARERWWTKQLSELKDNGAKDEK